jgi:hypothetical protein
MDGTEQRYLNGMVGSNRIGLVRYYLLDYPRSQETGEAG